MDICGLLPVLIPEIKDLKSTAQDFYGRNGVWRHTISGLTYLEEILPALGKYLPRHAAKITAHLEEKLAGEVSRATTLKLAYLLHDLGKPSTHTKEGKRSRFYGHELAGVRLAEKVQTRLHFSNKEIQTVRNIIANHMRPGNLSALAQVTDKAIYRYFRDLKNEGLDTLVLSLADAYTTEATVIKRNKQNIYPVDSGKHLKAVRDIINRYYTRPQQIVPHNLLNGSEIMSRFRLAPGPLIGKLINELKEAQAQKLVTTKPQAYSYLKNIIDKAPNLP
jgi:putative nucleotidyltransferase with HDIG domain